MVVFHRTLAIPLLAIGFIAAALIAPPPVTLFVLALAIAVRAFAMPKAAPWLPSAPTKPAAQHAVTARDASADTTPDDALDLVRMDDDGGWQMAPRRP